MLLADELLRVSNAHGKDAGMEQWEGAASDIILESKPGEGTKVTIIFRANEMEDV